MATISKQGGRRYAQMRTPTPNFQEQAQWLPSVGKIPPGTLTRTFLVGFRNRTFIVKPR